MGAQDKEEGAPVARPFVNMGVRRSTKDGKRVLHVQPLNDDLTAAGQRAMAFQWERGYPDIVGGIYRGASFSDSQVLGLKAARWSGERWPSRDDVIGWTAQQRQAEDQIAAERLAANAARVDEIRDAMLPLRSAYAKMSARGDFSGCHALAQVVAETLRIAPRAHEKEKP